MILVFLLSRAPTQEPQLPSIREQRQDRLVLQLLHVYISNLVGYSIEAGVILSIYTMSWPVPFYVAFQPLPMML